ncbi:MAG: hypothetical protein QF473_10455 [Planctomycetota bacterium]|nr:hypothetical protein [Planctomycetota bacterium]
MKYIYPVSWWSKSVIPEFNEWGFLPEGIHQTSLDEFKERFAIFAGSDRRFRLFEQLERLIIDAQRSGIVRRVLVAGSFVSAKPAPNDFDSILILRTDIFDKALKPFHYNLVAGQRARRMYGGDVLSAVEGSQALERLLDFFQTSRDGRTIGIVEIQL